MTVKLIVKNFPKGTKIVDIKKFFDKIKILFIKMNNYGNGHIEVKEKYEAMALNMNNKAYKTHSIMVKKFTEKDLDDKKKPKKEKSKFPIIDEKVLIEKIEDTGRLFLRNLRFDVTEADVVELFKDFGELVEVHVPYDFNLKRGKGYGYVNFMLPKDAVKAFTALDKTKFKGLNIHILPADEKPDGQKCKGVLEKSEDQLNSEDEEASFQKKKTEELKATASSSHNWNAVFVSSAAVAQFLADQYEIPLSELHSGAFKGSLSVKLAHAETQLVGKIREFLTTNRIKLDVLDNLLNRGHKSKGTVAVNFALSSTTFIVKNLTPGTTVEELRELFGRYSGLERVLLPPYGVTAIVTYGLPQQAKLAYQSSAYNEFKETVLMLQWAPVDLFEESICEEKLIEPISEAVPVMEMLPVTTKKSEKKKRKAEEKLQKEVESKKQKLDEEKEAREEQERKEKEELDAQRSKKVIVKNISFQATLKELEELFQPFEGITGIRMPKKSTGGHKGFAFVEFETADQAQVLVETMGISTHFLGRRLVFQYSEAA